MKRLILPIVVLILINTTMISSALNSISNQSFNKKNEIVGELLPWPMFCHDLHHTGRSPFSAANNSGTIKWSFPLYGWGMYGSACINSEGTIYVPDIYRLYALNPNGTLKWQIIINGWGESCPALDKNGTIYFGSSMGEPSYFYAVNPEGILKWRYWLGGGVYVKSSSALGPDGTIYFGCENNIIALYPNGTLRWQHPTGDSVYSSPAIGDDGTVYCGCHDTYLYALYPNNGTLKWRFKTGDWIRVSPSISDDGTVYCVSTDKYLYALYPNNGTMKWKTDVYAGTSPTIGPDGTIYAGWNSLHAVNPVDGSIKWTYPATYIEGGTPCTSSDGTIFFGTTSGDLIALNPDGTLHWQTHIGGCESASAISRDGTIYIGSVDSDQRGYMNAIGNGEPKRIEIIEPQPRRRYIFGLDFGPTLLKRALIIGMETVRVKAYHGDEIVNVTFSVDGKSYFSDTTTPYEWKMNQRFGDKLLMAHTITVTAYYKGGCKWTESVPIWYFHFFLKITR